MCDFFPLTGCVGQAAFDQPLYKACERCSKHSHVLSLLCDGTVSQQCDSLPANGVHHHLQRHYMQGIWSRALGLPIERPKSITMGALERKLA